MTKVKVSKKVAKILDKAHSGVPKFYKDSLLAFMHRIGDAISDTMYYEWLEQNNLTDEDLINAYKHGWEVEYEFQVGDIVLSKNSNVLEVGTGNPTYKIPQGEINSHKDYFELICKDEDRKDKKSIK